MSPSKTPYIFPILVDEENI